jgi:hypothetical protein
LSIMNGSAGQVVETMFSLCGGSSGAALPATMTSLLCNLLVDAGHILSLLSSFSVQEQCDVGVRTAVRLLLPHAPPKCASGPAANDMTEESSTEEDGSIIYEPRIAAMVAMHYLTGLPRRTPRPTTSCSCARASFGSDPSSSPKRANRWRSAVDPSISPRAILAGRCIGYCAEWRSNCTGCPMVVGASWDLHLVAILIRCAPRVRMI